jgi:hypothetical protein
VSIAVHALLALVLLKVEKATPPPRPETIEVTVTTQSPSSPVRLARPPAPTGVDQAGRSAPMLIASKRSQPTARGEDRPAEMGEPTVPEPAPPAERPTGEPGEGNRLGTLLPAHPDLSAAGHLADLVGQRRDPLAPPGSGTKLAPPRELPKVLHGGAGVTADVAEDGTIRFRDAKNLGYDARAWNGRFDITDAVMRGAGQDPYAPIKQQLADETREQRICMAKAAQNRRQSAALLELSARVKAIAARADLAPRERRQVIFEIWDECTEGPGDSSVDYGGMARAIILSTIREVFPAGGELAYQPAELVAMNRRRTSRERFAPYGAQMAKTCSATGGASGSTLCP